MQDKLIVQSPFSPALQEIAAQCRMRPVTEAADFVRYPPLSEIDTRRATGLTELDIESQKLPYIHGNNNPRWIRHISGIPAVTKLHNYDMSQSAAAEWIFFMLGDAIGAAVPPAQIFANQVEDITWYRSASFRAFPDSRSEPSPDLIIADGSAPVIAILDQWAKHTERHRGHIVAGTVTGKETPAMGYVDNGHLDIMEDPSDGPSRSATLWPRRVKEHIRESVLSCPRTLATFDRVHETPDEFIRDIVHAVPSVLLEDFHVNAQKLIDGFRARRDKIVPLMRTQLGLT